MSSHDGLQYVSFPSLSSICFSSPFFLQTCPWARTRNLLLREMLLGQIFLIFSVFFHFKPRFQISTPSLWESVFVGLIGVNAWLEWKRTHILLKPVLVWLSDVFWTREYKGTILRVRDCVSFLEVEPMKWPERPIVTCSRRLFGTTRGPNLGWKRSVIQLL